MADSIKRIINGIAVPIVAIGVQFELLASNDLSREEFPEFDDETGFDAFLARNEGLKERLQDCLQSGNSRTAKISASSGFRRDYSVTVVNIGNVASKAHPVLLMTFKDRSLQKEVKSMRTGFVANVSHEIRSPLTAISGFVETLQGSAINDVEMRTRFLGMMSKEVTRMTNLVSDLLSLSQVEAKERRALKKEVQPNMIITQAVQSISAAIEKSDKIFTVNVDEDLPAVIGRQDDLVRVLINLLENAMAYSRGNGEIRLTATTVSADNPLGGAAVCFSVSDDGEGIAQEEIPHLTQRFYRVDKSRSRNMGGTGLGLAIVKHILLHHQGKLDIQSEFGKGSNFRVYLPLA